MLETVLLLVIFFKLKIKKVNIFRSLLVLSTNVPVSHLTPWENYTSTST